MARATKKQKINLCRRRVESAKAFREAEGLDDLWRRMNGLYTGKHYEQADQDSIVVNVCFPTINVIAPSVSVNHPHITVTPRHADAHDQALIAEAVVNYWWKHYDVLPEFQASVKDSLIYGHGWIKTGWRFVEEDEPDPDYAANVANALSEADLYAADNPEFADELPVDADIEASIPSMRAVTVEDRPFIERCSVHDVFVDPEATTIRDARWIAQRIVYSKQELDMMGQFKSSVVRKLDPDGTLDQSWFASALQRRRKDNYTEDRYTVWEYYDITAGIMAVIPSHGDEFLIDPVETPYSFGHPFVFVPNYEVPDQFYPIGELEMIEPLQHELNLTRTQLFNDRKQYRRKWLIRDESFTAAGRAALESDADNVMVPVTDDRPFSDLITAMPSQSVNPQLYSDSPMIENDITNITGISEYMRGAQSEIRRSATEAAIIQDASNARSADKLAKVERAISEVGRRMVALAQQYMTEPQTARIVGRNGSVEFEFEPEFIEGEFDFTVEGGSTRPMNETMRRKTALDLLQALAPYGDPQLGLINMREVVAHALEYGFQVKDVNRFLAAPSEPMSPADEMLPPEEGMLDPSMMPPPDLMAGGMPLPGMLPEEPMTGMDPALLAQLVGQMGIAVGPESGTLVG